MKRHLIPLALVGLPLSFATSQEKPTDGFVSIYDGKTLSGWHVSAKTGHSAASKHQTGGKWVVEDGASGSTV